MNRLPDVEPVLRAYLADTGDRAPDRVLVDVAARITRHPRQRTWRLSGRPFMNTYAKVALGAAAILIVAVVGYTVLPRNGAGPGGPTIVPSPTATAAPSVGPTASGIGVRNVPYAGGLLDPGQWRFQVAAETSNVSIVGDIPAGWSAFEDQHGLEDAVATNGGPAGLAIFFEVPTHGVFSDPCHWDLDGSGTWEQDGDVPVGPTAADLVAALHAVTSYTSSTPSPIAFGSYAGQQLELRLPADLDPATCDAAVDEVEGNYRVMPDTFYAQGQANIWRVAAVDVAGTRIVAILEYFPGTDPARLAAAEAILASLRFTP